MFQENAKLQAVIDLGGVTLKKRRMVTSLYPVWNKVFTTLWYRFLVTSEGVSGKKGSYFFLFQEKETRS